MSHSEEQRLSPLAAELAHVLDGARTKRVEVDVLFECAHGFDPGLVGDPQGRARVRTALDELGSTRKITFPADGSRTGWDTRASPPIPNWVMRVMPPAPSKPEPIRRVWPKALEAAGRIATRADEQEVLERIASWMRDTPTPAPAPVQERSLELFDDEKALERYLKTRLFTTGALSLDSLACFAPPLPFVSQYVRGEGRPRLLVVENLATYNSFLTALRRCGPDARPNLHVGWGHGTSFTQSVLSIPMLEPAPDHVYYFGDLDLAGLQIAVRAAAQAEAAGLPRLRPAEAHYRFLLDGSASWRKPDASNRHASSDYAAVCRWLPGPLQNRVLPLLQARQRIPQERLGTSVLVRNPGLGQNW
ncbi:hypothetical protein [Nocardiopsis sp. FR4]|uniref:hypothetical protein n=1 Tax=Nocardiopsis sp. FR4 TaxID=2605985 RepID=UPI00135C2CB9|nr:hypothetical protein [Nocardiopsis sp. FR4]